MRSCSLYSRLGGGSVFLLYARFGLRSLRTGSSIGLEITTFGGTGESAGSAVSSYENTEMHISLESRDVTDRN